MTLGEEMQYVSDLAEHQFAAVTTITAIVPIEECRSTGADDANFDYLAAVAGHIYYVKTLTIDETKTITGKAALDAYDIVPTIQEIVKINQNVIFQRLGPFWCTRLEHDKDSATGGDYAIIYSGFDLTFV